jgi:hypothetical protein
VGAIKCELQDVRGKVLVYDKMESFSETVRSETVQRMRFHFTVEGTTPTLQRFALEKSASSAKPDSRVEYALGDSFLPLDEIAAFKAMLVGKTIYPLRPFWYDNKGETMDESRKYVPLKVTDVRYGTTGYQQIRILFESPTGQPLFFFARLNGAGDSFMLTDPKQKFPQVSPRAWEGIEQAKAQLGMSPQELELAIGKPRRKSSTQRAEGTVDIWQYDKRRIVLTDARVTEIADTP